MRLRVCAAVVAAVALSGAAIAGPMGTDAFVPGGLPGQLFDLNDAPNNRNAGTDLLESVTLKVVLPIPLQSLTSQVPGIITPRVDFGDGTQTTQGDGTVLNRGGYSSGTIPPWQGLFNDLGVVADMDGDHIAGLWSGKVSIPENATFRFTTRSDDGSVLFIDGVRVVNNNFNQGMTNRSGDVVLTGGLHDILVAGFEGGGGAGWQASWEQLDGGAPFGRRIIEPTALFNDVVTPGTFVSGGLRGDYYDVNNPPNNQNAGTGLLNGVNLTTDYNQIVLETLTPQPAIQPTLNPHILDFGSGTETNPGDGSNLNRGGTGGNLYGGIGGGNDNDQVAGLWIGALLVPQTANYQFTVRSDDGSRFWLDRNGNGVYDLEDLIASRNQFGGMGNTTSGNIFLQAGVYHIRAATFEGSGGAGFQLSWQQMDGQNPFGRQIIPASNLGFVPEPGTLALLGLGFAGLRAWRRRRAA